MIVLSGDDLKQSCDVWQMQEQTLVRACARFLYAPIELKLTDSGLLRLRIKQQGSHKSFFWSLLIFFQVFRSISTHKAECVFEANGLLWSEALRRYQVQGFFSMTRRGSLNHSSFIHSSI